MKNIARVIRGIFGAVSAIAGIGSLTACTEIENDPPATEYGPSPFYDVCVNNGDCIKCCEQADDVEVCVEDYIKNGYCAGIATEYGPIDAPDYGPIDP
ncbi:MAG: hypothetical protein IJ165_04535 [Proteobacteria bacterium]|nr:hypothetical protein [Pseudomonadota bacterium]